MKAAQPEAAVAKRFGRLRGALNERARRLFGASEALAYGYGGIAVVARATGMAPRTIGAGIKELRELENSESVPSPQRIRRIGAGRKKTVDKDPRLMPALERLLESRHPDIEGGKSA